MQTPSSNPVTPVSEVKDMPNIAQLHGKPNPQTPVMCSPAESQIMNAIKSANTTCLRAWAKDALSEYQWKIIEALGEHDSKADPGESMLKSAVALLVFNWSLKADKNTDDVIKTLLGTESAHFDNSSARCDVEFTK